MRRWLEPADRIDAGLTDRNLHVCRHGSRAEPHDADALFAIFLCSAGCQRENGGFGCAIMAPAFQRTCGRAGADIDDCTASCGQHSGDRCPKTVIDALEVDIDNTAPDLGIAVRQAGNGLNEASIVDEAIEMPEPGHCTCDSALDIRVVADIPFHRNRAAAGALDILFDFGKRLAATGQQYDIRALSSEVTCNGLADATACAGDESCLVCKLSHNTYIFSGNFRAR